MTDEIAKAVVNSSALGKAYDDLIHPSAEPIGEIVGYIPRTLRLWLNGWRRWIANGEESVELTLSAVSDEARKIPEEHLVEPPAHVAVPAIQQLAYSYDSKELRGLYAKLLLASMDDRTAEYVHPSFVEILRQISPDEAKLLHTFVGEDEEEKHAIPIVDLRIVAKDAIIPSRWKMALEGYSSCCDDVCEHPEQVNVYLCNLERLGILERADFQLVDLDDAYVSLESSDVIQKAQKALTLSDDERFDIHRWSYFVTAYGLSFIRVCVA